MATDVKPNNTIYINNLNEKVKKDGKRLVFGESALQVTISP